MITVWSHLEFCLYSRLIKALPFTGKSSFKGESNDQVSAIYPHLKPILDEKKSDLSHLHQATI